MTDHTNPGNANPCERSTHRDAKEIKALVNRLSRIEGQIRGIRGMVEKDAYCTDIMTQVTAVTAALTSLNRNLLEQHIRTCVANDIRSGHDDAIDDLSEALRFLVR